MTIIERAIQAARAKAASSSTAEQVKEVRSASRVTPLPRPTHESPDQIVAFPRLDTGGSLVTEIADPKVYEQFRRLKRPLLQCAFGPLATPGTQTIMITSPLQGAGKTFVSSNLAYALALEKDRNVLLIDTDNANPTLTRQMGLTGRPGLYDLISDTGLGLEQVVCRTDVPGLWLLPAGKTAADSLELLNSRRCQDIFQQLAERDPNGIIILDAPPLLITNEAPAVTALAGQFLLVVEAGVTPRSSVTRSLEILDTKKPVGLVLNKARGKGELSSYYPTYPYPNA
jgi:protein-tyrosine kinase